MNAGTSRFEIVPLGADVPDYFPGFGTAFSTYEHSVVGTGDTEAEAYDDACEQIAQALPSVQFAALGLPESYGREESIAEEGDCDGVQFYVGIRYNP